jgi:hypothetical protein
MQSCLATNLQRFYPQSVLDGPDALTVDAPRGGRAAFQVVFRTEDAPRTVAAAVVTELPVQVRRVGYVPMPHLNADTPADEIDGLAHLPGYAPDPLFPETEIVAGPFETNAFWLTVRVPKDAAPGAYPVAVTLTAGEETVTLTAAVQVHAAVLPARQHFPVTHWFYADALLDWYKLQPFEEAFWPILDAYFADVAEHGQDTVYVPVFTPPLDGVKRPTQLLHVTREGGTYHFDWTLVRRWIAAARAAGITHFEWTHFFTQWGVKYAIRIYEGHDGPLLWEPETGATSETYRTFLTQFLPQLRQFLRDEGLVECSFFHVSDEPHGEEHLANYRAARALLKELAPWMPTMDALSEIDFARQGLTDIPIPIINNAPQFIAEGFPAWAYFCCAPRGRYLNRLFDTPLPKIAMAGWLFYRTQVRGFLHWGYNYWFKSQTQQLIDPFTVADGLAWPGWAHGDTFLVYPGPAGPIDSLRWEVFADSLQDYTLLQAAGIAPDDLMLAEITDYADFPKEAGWILERRKRVLERLSQ